MPVFSRPRVPPCRWLLWHSFSTNFHFVRDSAPNPAGEAYDAPTDFLVSWGERYPSPFPTLIDALGVSQLDAGIAFSRF